jgi:fatty-acyl-CoA synthase
MAALVESRVAGATAPALMEETIPAALGRAIAAHRDREALVVRHQDVRWSYAEFGRAVEATAAGLVALGLEPGQRIGIWAPNCVEWVITQFATAAAGLILVNINPAYRTGELEHALGRSGCTALITAVRFKTSDYLGMLRQLVPEIDAAEPGRLAAEALPDLRLVIRMGEEKSPGMLNFADLAGQATADSRERLKVVTAGLDANDAINIQFTSGTTGLPKGATLTHRNILNNGFFTGEAMGFSEQDRLCIPVPLYHCFGMVLGNLACVTHGAAMIFPDEAFDPLSVLETVAAERCTALHGVPTMFIAELDHPEFSGFDLGSLRTGIMAGAPCPIEVMKRVISDMGLDQVTIAYGMTETSPVSFQSAVDDPLDKRVSTVGRIQPHVEVKVVDEAGQTVAPSVQGELLTRGYSVMQGYWGDEAATAASIDAEGWMHTGDLAVLDEDGYCMIVGRVKDMVIRGGENVYPREIEEYLYRHPVVQDVQVFGVPDEKYGEEICAWVILKEGATADEEELRAFCRGQIAHYKVPRTIRFVDEFPMTVTGKPQKFIMREQMIAEAAEPAAAQR